MNPSKESSLITRLRFWWHCRNYPAPTGRVIRMEDHRGWGNAISWIGEMRLTGHMTPKPRAGDEVRAKLKSGRMGRFAVLRIEHANGVRDMFFADAGWLGYEDEQQLPVTTMPLTR